MMMQVQLNAWNKKQSHLIFNLKTRCYETPLSRHLRAWTAPAFEHLDYALEKQSTLLMMIDDEVERSRMANWRAIEPDWSWMERRWHIYRLSVFKKRKRGRDDSDALFSGSGACRFTSMLNVNTTTYAFL